MSAQMHNLTTLIKRLEAATSRLEDLVTPAFEDPASTAPKENGSNSTTTNRSTNASGSNTPAPAALAAPAAVAAASTISPPKPADDPVPESVEDFDNFLDTSVKKYVDLSNEIGGAVAAQAARVAKVFQNERTLLLISTLSKKPESAGSDYMELLKPLQQEIRTVIDVKDANRGSELSNQLSAVAESIGVIAWVTLDNKPFKHVDDSLGSAQYFGNRVLKEFKEKDPQQVQWIQAYYQIFKDLSAYVKNTFPNGLTWNANGVSPKEAMKIVSSRESTPSQAAAPSPSPSPSPAPSVAAGGPPPPPPPPPGPAPKFDIKEAAKPAAAVGGIGAVFSELNKGDSVTKGLKKVSANEMTHKNPSLRASSIVPDRSESLSPTSSINRNKSPAPRKTPKPESLRTKKPPKKELDGNKWIIEHYDNEAEPIEIEASISQSILISRCNKTTIRIIGKANAISIDNSPRLSLVIDSLVSSVDVIKSSNFALQVLGTLPTILLDQVDGAQVYLGKDSMNTEVFSSKSSSINLNIIQGEDEDYKEVALPEQIRTYIGKNGQLISEIVEHAG
ncbi:hypothetical protein V500_04829 [Pseudogymnoascus sp. VKM F-4518 (FW-2643)]|nr:hypothetical protein V500_04829 [Pseudogymnoascus sp. VKM F-4518 (FW-2643)]